MQDVHHSVYPYIVCGLVRVAGIAAYDFSHSRPKAFHRFGILVRTPLLRPKEGVADMALYWFGKLFQVFSGWPKPGDVFVLHFGSIPHLV